MPAATNFVKATLRPLFATAPVTRAASTATLSAARANAAAVPELAASPELVERHLANMSDSSPALRELPNRVAEYESWTAAQPRAAKRCWDGVVADLQ